MYRARTTRFDRQFRLLDTEISVADLTGAPVASGVPRSYVPFTPVVVDLPGLATRLSTEAAQLKDKVALVVGGSRGLGADIAAVLGLAGARVAIVARRDDSHS